MNNLTENQRRWARTLLIIYPRTKKILQALAESRMRIAQNSFSVPGMQAFEKISERNYRMQGILNVYVLVKDALTAIGTQRAELLVNRHFGKKSAAELADLAETSVRNVYRWYDKALETFYNFLDKDGHGEAWLCSQYGTDPLVMGLFRRADGKIFAAKRKKHRHSEPLTALRREIKEVNSGYIA